MSDTKRTSQPGPPCPYCGEEITWDKRSLQWSHKGDIRQCYATDKSPFAAPGAETQEEEPDEPDWTALAEALTKAGQAMQEQLRIMGVALNAAGAAFRQAFQIATEEANEGKVPE